MSLEIKICGLRTAETVRVAVDSGADMIGFVFYPRSPRHLEPAAAAELAAAVRGRAQIVALTVDADDALLDEIVTLLQPEILQLHGSESPRRVADIRTRSGRSVMKAIKIADATDLAVLPAFAPVVDRFLFDAKAPQGLAGALPGGNGLAFDGRLIAGLDLGKPAMLSGGLDAGNVAEAIRLTGIRGIDVSSGVESRPGEKDPDRIRAFIAAARSALA